MFLLCRRSSSCLTRAARAGVSRVLLDPNKDASAGPRTACPNVRLRENWSQPVSPTLGRPHGDRCMPNSAGAHAQHGEMQLVRELHTAQRREFNLETTRFTGLIDAPPSKGRSPRGPSWTQPTTGFSLSIMTSSATTPPPCWLYRLQEATAFALVPLTNPDARTVVAAQKGTRRRFPYFWAICCS